VLRFEEAHNGEVSDQVRAQSDLLAQLSKQLVGALQKALPDQAVKKDAHASSTAKRNQKTAAEQSEQISIPVVDPVRELEVYRF
jgi:broad specificity phosphatase PhoE